MEVTWVRFVVSAGGCGGMDRVEVAVSRQTSRHGFGRSLGEQERHDQSLRVDVSNDVERRCLGGAESGEKRG